MLQPFFSATTTVWVHINRDFLQFMQIILKHKQARWNVTSSPHCYEAARVYDSFIYFVPSIIGVNVLTTNKFGLKITKKKFFFNWTIKLSKHHEIVETVFYFTHKHKSKIKVLFLLKKKQTRHQPLRCEQCLKCVYGVRQKM